MATGAGLIAVGVGGPAVWRGELERAMGPVLVVVVGVDVQNSFEVAAAEDENAVEAIVADGAHLAFGERVRIRSLNGSADHLDPLAAKDLVERAAELRVAVVDQQAEAVRLLAELHDEVAGLLGDPGAVGVGCAGDELESARGEREEEEDVDPL